MTVKEGVTLSPALNDELKQHVAHKIGAIARPDDIIFAADLPKTRSGKIMRRLLRDIAEGKALGDTTTLADPSVVQKLKEQYDEDERGAAHREIGDLRDLSPELPDLPVGVAVQANRGITPRLPRTGSTTGWISTSSRRSRSPSLTRASAASASSMMRSASIG